MDLAFILLCAAGFLAGVRLGERVPPPLWGTLVSGFLTLLCVKVLVTPRGRPEDILILASVVMVLSCPMVGGALGAAIGDETDE